MKYIYPLLSSITGLPLAAYCLMKSDLRSNTLRRFWPEKIDIPDDAEGARIWIHAASAGEVKLANLFCKTWMDAHGPTQFLLTCNTTSGMEAASGGPCQFVQPFPFDAYPALRKIFGAFKPDILVLTEMELWPGLMQMARKRAVPTVVINARLSAESAERYAGLDRLFDGYLSQAGYMARSDLDLVQLNKAGVPLERILITGEMKVDLASGPIQDLAPVESDDRQALTLLAASTHRGEDQVILDAFLLLRESFPDLQLVIAPRHLRRVPSLVSQCAGRKMAVARSKDYSCDELGWADIVVEDGFGRLDRWYRRAALVFVGGSLVDAGGHSVLEPILHRCPILIGPEVKNWVHWVEFLDDAGALSTVRNAADISRLAAIALDEREDVLKAVEKARLRVRQQLGASLRNVDIIKDLLNGGDPFVMG